MKPAEKSEAVRQAYPSERPVGILLAGGLSRRYGSPKAFAEYGGRLFHERAREALSVVCDPVVVSASIALSERFSPSCDVRTDLPELAGQGPLAGICTVMRSVPAGRYITLPCDMPRIGPEEIRRLESLARTHAQADVVAVRTASAHLPLLSVWKGGLDGLLETRIREGRLAVMKLLAELDTVWLDASQLHEDPRIFHNFNTPDAD
ncbi:molybdenum cofactor guanylyltransferase [Saccharibacillus alkalitolerans]|uniref:molybdenum cofactor guanylyltransferase n=1 Tax=Saccharibacillus alkalitolerans TaxID=2705290 RepID=UPI002E2E7A1B|nr:molybdenum cofactor guanylyltransferase [Saccharibacillus alkalitolerans]